jgi:hypothetical protein
VEGGHRRLPDVVGCAVGAGGRDGERAAADRNRRRKEMGITRGGSFA